MLFSSRSKLTLPSAEDALPGRDTAIPVTSDHTVLGTPLTGPFPEGMITWLIGGVVLIAFCMLIGTRLGRS